MYIVGIKKHEPHEIFQLYDLMHILYSVDSHTRRGHGIYKLHAALVIHKIKFVSLLAVKKIYIYR